MHQPLTYEVNGDAIRKERMQAGLTQTELAEKAGISPRYISHLENGTRRRMGPKTYKRLREVLNATDARLRRTPRPTEDPPPHHERN
ncbi:helix-turn-helix domain-containing protein [Streptomyces europaeiscabiei]|jgi:transcriptional regulator with XRE-family HTH domain|uniref:helix-turn-helix domain-containing protein n=1 Tax=Streptomyces europaeiscabiei TaxID=146819 RepID=UPI00299FC010|nr:helix-turn-helix transcriptional regulator [Streptomyces europaeiscabiei]MDX3835663.1 helix-turn-helix transcriptional regulator [Streptomyces europaeiscabiei]